MRKREPLVFWRRDYRIVGAAPVERAAMNLHAALLSSTRFSVADRLVGSVRGNRIRAWKKTLFGRAADTIEFDGVLEPSGAGSALVGVLRYNTGTRIQLVGFPVLGLFLAGMGLLQRIEGVAGGGQVFWLGVAIAAVGMVWAYSAGTMRERHIAWLDEQLGALLERQAA